MHLGLLTRLFTASDGQQPDTDEATEGSAYAQLMASRQGWQGFEERLDLAQEIGATHVELTQAGVSSGAEYLLKSTHGRERLLDALDSRGLSIGAMNCSGMPLHPVDGPRFTDLMDKTIRLANLLGVDTIVAMSGVGGDGPGSTTVNWAFYPWPESSVALTKRQWQQGISFWTERCALAESRGVRIALELHPLHLVYNVPSLRRLQQAVGPTIGATVDPSHLFWQQMDPAAVIRELGDSVYHVQLKDTTFSPAQLAIAGVLDDRPFDDPDRAWVQRTVGRGHSAEEWREILQALKSIGYSRAMCIENEDPEQSYADGVREAGNFLRPLLAAL